MAMESPLEVLSRAATMVQDNANEARLTTKELPTTKWRRDRRLRTTEYHHYSSSSSSPPSPQIPHSTSIKPLTETTNTATIDCPIDMSVTSTTIKPRSSPPPPYREPLPGSTFATALARPSVIKCTQAPKRDNHYSNNHHHHSPISNRENDNCSTESISMCDPVIDEHFRRSLGADYMALFGKKSPTQQSPSPPQSLEKEQLSQQPQEQQVQQQLNSPKSPSPIIENSSPIRKSENRLTSPVSLNGSDSIGISVDDHFAKALGDTWKKLQADREMKNDAIEK